MAGSFRFAHRVEFQPEGADELLRAVAAAPGVFSLRGEPSGDGAASEPYLSRAADLRRRLRRLLAPPDALDANGQPMLSKRLNLRQRVRTVEWTETGSEFESMLLLYRASRAAFGPERARKRLRLYTPYCVRVTMGHAHPRVYVTNRISHRAVGETFGPFPSRLAAERYADAVLDLFKLRRCWEDLVVHPDHPGCAYGEMRKCLAPCKVACSAEEYAAEANAVHAFFTSGGQSMLQTVAAERDAASEAMDFEAAAALHKQWERVRVAGTQADELVRPLSQLRALILQEAARDQAAGGRMEAAVFLFEAGQIAGPEPLSTLGVRAVREQTAVGSSLFAQPLMLGAVPLVEPTTPHSGQGGAFTEERLPAATRAVSAEESAATEQARRRPQEDEPVDASEDPVLPAHALIPDLVLSPEERARAVLLRLEAGAVEEPGAHAGAEERGDFLALFRRWYYRPEKQRAGEVFLPNADGSWPIRRVLNGAARVVLGKPTEMQATDREGAREAVRSQKTRVLHAGRPEVERVVPVAPKRAGRSRKALTPTDMLS